MCVYKRIKQVSVLKGVKLNELYRLSLDLDGKKTSFYGLIFLLPVEDKISKIGPEPAKPTISVAQPGSTVALCSVLFAGLKK